MTAEEILEKNDPFSTKKENDYFRKDIVIKSMQEFADQEKKEYAKQKCLEYKSILLELFRFGISDDPMNLIENLTKTCKLPKFE